MIIELIGCTSAGKSTCLAQLQQANSESQPEIISSYQLILRKTHATWLPNPLKKLLITLVGLGYCLVAYRQWRPLLALISQIIKALPGDVSLGEKCRIARLAARNLGIHSFVKRHQSAHQVVICDEGTLHIAHYLFVHASVAPDQKYLEKFVSRVPLADLQVYLRAPRELLVQRTLARGHKRLPPSAETSAQRAQVEAFINHARQTFEAISRQPRVRKSLLAFDAGTESVAEPILKLLRETVQRQALQANTDAGPAALAVVKPALREPQGRADH